MSSPSILIVYDSSRASALLNNLYDRTATGNEYRPGSYLYKDASIRDRFKYSMEEKLASWEKAASGSNVVTTQLEVAENLHDLNAIAEHDWEHTDPGFGIWLQMKIGQSNLLLDKIEREHPELKPHAKQTRIDLLIRSDAQRDKLTESMQQSIDSWNIRKHKDPRAVHAEIGDVLDKYESIVNEVNWFKIDAEFSVKMDRLIENMGGLKREIEREHPELK